MIQTAFVDAARPKPCCILRLPMLPYSLGHEIILLRERNPLVVLDSKEFEKLSGAERCKAVIQAALICSRPYSAYGTPHRWMRVWEFFLRWEDPEKSIDQFRAYHFDGSTFPLPPDREAEQIANGKDDEGRQLGGELLPRLIDYLAPRAHAIGFKSVYDIPLGMGLHLYFTALEALGHIRIENAKERQVREEMAGHRAAIAREREEAARKEMEKCQH